MCTYNFQRIACCCQKGPDCQQGASGLVHINGNLHHLIPNGWAPIDDLGAACDYQRQLKGRRARATRSCPRFYFDPARVIEGSYVLTALACIRCVETCAPPGTLMRAPGPDDPPGGPEGFERPERLEGYERVGGYDRLGGGYERQGSCYEKHGGCGGGGYEKQGFKGASG